MCASNLLWAAERSNTRCYAGKTLLNSRYHARRFEEIRCLACKWEACDALKYLDEPCMFRRRVNCTFPLGSQHLNDDNEETPQHNIALDASPRSADPELCRVATGYEWGLYKTALAVGNDEEVTILKWGTANVWELAKSQGRVVAPAACSYLNLSIHSFNTRCLHQLYSSFPPP